MSALQIFEDLAEMGLTVGEALQVTDSLLAAKTASGTFGLPELMKVAPGAVTTATGWLRNTTGALKNTLEGSVPLMLAAGAIPLAGGYIVGDSIAGALDTDGSDVADIHEQELIRELEANAEALRQKTKLRSPAAV